MLNSMRVLTQNTNCNVGNSRANQSSLAEFSQPALTPNRLAAIVRSQPVETLLCKHAHRIATRCARQLAKTENPAACFRHRRERGTDALPLIGSRTLSAGA